MGRLEQVQILLVLDVASFAWLFRLRSTEDGGSHGNSVSGKIDFLSSEADANIYYRNSRDLERPWKIYCHNVTESNSVINKWSNWKELDRKSFHIKLKFRLSTVSNLLISKFRSLCVLMRKFNISLPCRSIDEISKKMKLFKDYREKRKNYFVWSV